MWIPWGREGSATLEWGVVILSISLPSVHTQALFCHNGNLRRKNGQQKVWFLEVLNIAFHFHVCLTNVSGSLETARKGVRDGDHPAMERFKFLLLLATMV